MRRQLRGGSDLGLDRLSSTKENEEKEENEEEEKEEERERGCVI